MDWEPRRRALVEAEAAVLCGGRLVAPGLYLSERPFAPGRAAFAIEGGVLLAAGDPSELQTPPGALVHVVKGPFKADGHPKEFLARLPQHPQIGPRRTKLQLYCTGGPWLLVRRSEDAAFSAPELPRRTSTSLSSRLGRALVNLVARPGERVLDPVCGTGAALVEAARIGCVVEGSDLTWKAVVWARENLAALGLEGAIRREDALIRAPALPLHDALIADLPYGRRLDPADLAAFARALPRLARRWALVAHVDLRPELAAAGTPAHTTIEVPKPTFVRYLHLGGERLEG